MSKKKRNRFANAIIALCVAAGIAITGAALYGYHRLDIPLPGDVLGKLLMFWGGELLIVALRQIFGSDCVKRTKKEDDGGESI